MDDWSGLANLERPPMTDTNRPSPHHKQRATKAIADASLLVGWVCARHHDDAEWGVHVDRHFDKLSDDEVNDVGNALVAILRRQIGCEPADALVATLPAGDMYAVAQLVAHTIDYDGWIGLRARKTANELAQFWGIADHLEDGAD